MGDIVLLTSRCNKRKMENTTEKRVGIDDLFNQILFRDTELSPENKARCVRRLYDWDAAQPFPIVKFAHSLGIEVFVENLSPINDDSLKGYLAIYPDEPAVIVVSEDESYGHQRWTVAHELWHYFTKRDEPRTETEFCAEHGNYGLSSADAEERNADRFAAALLMPEDEFRAIYRRLDADKDDVVEYLHRYFAVSETAIKKRIRALQLSS